MLATRRAIFGQSWQSLAVRSHPGILEVAGDHGVRIGETRDGAVLAEHQAAWTLDSQKDAIHHVRKHILSQPTWHLHPDNKHGARNTLLVLRFLHDFEGRLQLMQSQAENRSVEEDERDYYNSPPSSREEEEQEVEPPAVPCRWSSLELFCRPWVVSLGEGDVILRMHEHIPRALRGVCGLCSPCGLPLGALLAWVTLQSPLAFSRLHMRRIIGPQLSAHHVCLDSAYNVSADIACPEAIETIASRPNDISTLVDGALPEFSAV